MQLHQSLSKPLDTPSLAPLNLKVTQLLKGCIDKDFREMDRILGEARLLLSFDDLSRDELMREGKVMCDKVGRMLEGEYMADGSLVSESTMAQWKQFMDTEKKLTSHQQAIPQTANATEVIQQVDSLNSQLKCLKFSQVNEEYTATCQIGDQVQYVLQTSDDTREHLKTEYNLFQPYHNNMETLQSMRMVATEVSYRQGLVQGSVHIEDQKKQQKQTARQEVTKVEGMLDNFDFAQIHKVGYVIAFNKLDLTLERKSGGEQILSFANGSELLKKFFEIQSQLKKLKSKAIIPKESSILLKLNSFNLL